jgi:hypothetical protein
MNSRVTGRRENEQRRGAPTSCGSSVGAEAIGTSDRRWYPPRETSLASLEAEVGFVDRVLDQIDRVHPMPALVEAPTRSEYVPKICYPGASLNLRAAPLVNRTKPPLRIAAMAWVGEEDGASYVVGGVGKDPPGS